VITKTLLDSKQSALDDLLIKPTGKTIAEIVRIRPGAFVWNHGDELVERARAQPNEIKAPPMKELTNILSIRILALYPTNEYVDFLNVPGAQELQDISYELGRRALEI
jgi:hypothetical protein